MHAHTYLTCTNRMMSGVTYCVKVCTQNAASIFKQDITGRIVCEDNESDTVCVLVPKSDRMNDKPFLLPLQEEI